MTDPPTGKSWGERFSDELFSTHTEVTLRLGFAMFLGFGASLGTTWFSPSVATDFMYHQL
jgi:hypothetical protein|eukprot:scaffold361_cov214-Alexandrium_tamarense.AAC.2